MTEFGTRNRVGLKPQALVSSAAILCALVVITMFLWVAIPFKQGPLLGDDLEVTNAITDGKYANSIRDSLRSATQGKWRPLNTIFLHFESQFLSATYFNYWVVGVILLLVAVTIALGDLYLQVTRGERSIQDVCLVVMGTLVIGTSLFATMGLSGIFGFLEFGSLISCLVAFQFHSLAIRSLSRRHSVYGSLFSLVAILIHERFLTYSLVMAVLLAFRSRKQRAFRGMWLVYMSNVAFYIYSSAIVLDADFLKGGGEERLGDTFGWWVVPRTMFALVQLFGGSGASALYFEPDEPTVLIENQTVNEALRVLMPGLFLLTLVFLSVSYLRTSKTGSSQASNQPTSTCRTLDKVEPFVIAIALMLPATTVVSRIETRWLLGSFFFVVIGIVQLGIKQKIGRRVILLLAMLLLGNVLNVGSVKDESWWYRRTIAIVDYVQQEAPKSGQWSLVVVLDRPIDVLRNNSVAIWGTNYGRAFINYLDNAPNQITFGYQATVDSCQFRCLVVKVWDSEGSRGLTLVDADRQQISHVWVSSENGIDS